jgi:uncharacterized membrane protein YbhN (UPF0104 family)
MKKTGPLHYLGIVLVLAVFCLAAYLLAHHIRDYNQKFPDHPLTLASVWHDLLEIRWYWMLAAVGLTVLNYGILACYDWLAFRFAEVPISFRRVTFAAVTSYAFSYNLGATLAGIPLRLRLYTAWNIPLTKIVQLLVILAFTFWFGVFALAGVLFVVDPLRIPDLQAFCQNLEMQWHIPHDAVRWFAYFFADSRAFGYCLLGLAGGYVGISLLHSHALKFFSKYIPNYIWKLPVPPPKLTLYQIGIASADMLVAGAVFYMLCPNVRGGYMTVLEVYMVAFVLNVLSHVPGGWGVIEATIMTLLAKLDYVPEAGIPRVLAAIVVFRVIYFLLPLLFSVVLIGWHEYALRKNWIKPLVPFADDASPNGEAHGQSAKPRAEKA